MCRSDFPIVPVLQLAKADWYQAFILLESTAEACDLEGHAGLGGLASRSIFRYGSLIRLTTRVTKGPVGVSPAEAQGCVKGAIY